MGLKQREQIESKDPCHGVSRFQQHMGPFTPVHAQSCAAQEDTADMRGLHPYCGYKFTSAAPGVGQGGVGLQRLVLWCLKLNF